MIAHGQRGLGRLDQLRTFALVSVLGRFEHAILFTLRVASRVDRRNELVMCTLIHMHV